MKSLHQYDLVRRIALPILKALAFDTSIANPYAPGHRVRINTFTHKGYWFHGRNRELETMQRFEQVIRPGQTVIEVGGHIGYVTQMFSRLVGQSGHVYVFEPGLNNLPFLRRNIEKLGNTTLVEKGAADRDGVATFYEESLSGQNNSLQPDYRYLKKNAAEAFVDSTVRERQIQVTTLDTFCEAGIRPDFIKIDVEGFELSVVKGMSKVLAHRPVLMIEVSVNNEELERLLRDAGYALFDSHGNQLSTLKGFNANVFCHPSGQLT